MSMRIPWIRRSALERVEENIMATDKMRNYEEVAQFTLDPADCEQLLKTQTECTFIWRMRDGWPIGVVMSYVWHDGKVWMTASAQRPRIPAIRRDDRVSVVVSSAGTSLPPRTVTIRGRCRLYEDEETKHWFYPDLAKALIPNDAVRQGRFVKMLDSPRRVVMCIVPEKFVTFDSQKMRTYWRGGAEPE
jgi:nitroimidazol reductase NimA-like FMN-containing flavoprotein (pyridoxamine 5'-phosphate oxidase superfamily)